MIRSIAVSLIVAFVSSIASSATIPPGADDAEKTLKASTRHGEYVDIALPGSDLKIKSWVVYPERKEKAGVVIVIHEIFGLTDWVRSVADQLAADGFIAVAPDLLSGKGLNGGGTDSFKGDEVRNAIRGLSKDEVASRLDAIRDHMLKDKAANGKSATIGFCWGGSASFNYAAHQTGLNTAIVYYGSGPDSKDAVAKVNGPVVGFYGSDDARVNATIDASEKAMKDAGKSFTKHIYDGAGHGFLRQQSAREANKKAAEEAWPETVKVLKANLE